MLIESKAENTASVLGDGANPVVRFYFEVCHLKHIYRKGWLQRGIPPERCESVAEHTFAVAMLAMSLAEEYFPELDSLRVLRLSLLHDLGEIDAGDLTPSDGVSRVEKSKRERASVERVCFGSSSGERIVELWNEYDAGRSPEARFVRQVEKLEMALQAAVYEKQGQKGLGDFLKTAEKEIEEPKLREILVELERLRTSS